MLNKEIIWRPNTWQLPLCVWISSQSAVEQCLLAQQFTFTIFKWWLEMDYRLSDFGLEIISKFDSYFLMTVSTIGDHFLKSYVHWCLRISVWPDKAYFATNFFQLTLLFMAFLENIHWFLSGCTDKVHINK